MELLSLWFTGVQCVLSGIELWVYAWMYWIIQHKSVIFSECITKVCLVLYRAESNLADRSKRFTLYTLTYLFIPTPTGLLWKALSLLQILREDYSLTYICMLQSPPLTRYSFIQLRELGVVEITNSASLWPFIVFIERLNLQFVCDCDSVACMHYASEWNARSKHYRMWYTVLHNPLNYTCYPVGLLH